MRPVYSLAIYPGYAGSGQELPALMVSSGTANVFSSWVQIGTTPPYPTNRISFLGRPYNGVAGSIPALINIGIGPSGSQQILLPNLMANIGGQYSAGPFGGGPFPIFVPPNQDLWAQMSINSTESNNFEIGCLLWEEDGPTYRTCVAYVDPSNSSGIVATLSSTSGSWGPYTLTTSFGPHKKFFLAVTPAGNTSYQSFSIALSTASSVFLPDFISLIANSDSEVTTPYMFGPFDASGIIGEITASGQFSQGVSGNAIQIALYGFN